MSATATQASMIRRGERGALGRGIGIVALILFFAVALVAIVAFTFSIGVYGKSMQPTLTEGDRLVTNFLGRDAVHRFDVVKTTAGEGGSQVVKRVIGMPGDTIEVLPTKSGEPPAVLLRPAGSDETYRVENSTWTEQVADRRDACCDRDGTSLKRGREAREVVVPDGSYWVIGDNWGGSDDSRVYGFVTSEMISATIAWRLTPISSFGPIPNHAELVEAD